MLFPIDLFFGVCYIVSVMREIETRPIDMSTTQAVDILKGHSVDWKIEESKLFAKDEFTNRDGQHGFVWTDITGWNHRDLTDWLGY